MKFKKLLKEATRRSLNEKSLNRIGQHLKGDRPFAMITAFRGEYTKKQNIERNKSMASKIKNMGYGYFFVNGHWIENQGTKNEIEVEESTIFAIGNENDTSFRPKIIKLCKEYNQEGVLIKDSNGIKVYNDAGKAIDSYSKLNSKTMGTIYTKIKRSPKSTFTFEEIEFGKGFIGKMIEKAKNKDK